MGKIGTLELVLILAVVLLIFGPSRLPALGKMVGGAFGKLRQRTSSWDDDLEDEEDEDAGEAAPEAIESAEGEQETAEAPETETKDEEV